MVEESGRPGPVASPADIELPAGVLTDSLDDVINDPEITRGRTADRGLGAGSIDHVAVDGVGQRHRDGEQGAVGRAWCRSCSLAPVNLGRSIAFEAAVAGGIPIIANISQCLSANQILSLEGILNGTSNFIVTQMDENGSSYDEVVREAQRLGYAEADPTMDVDGTDAAQKLAILAHLAFGATVDWSEIPRVGIDGLDPDDLQYAKELGYRIKLLAVANLAEDGLELSVAPTLVRDRHAVG